MDDFVHRLAGTVREVQGDLVADLTDDELHKYVTAGVERAFSHGLVLETSVGVFVGWMFEFAPNFDQQKKIKAMLECPGLSAEQRLDLVAQSGTDADWAEAEEMYDENAWNLPLEAHAN